MLSQIRFTRPAISLLAALALAPTAWAAQLGGTAMSVLPEATRQIVSINYHRLSADAGAQQVEAQVLPAQMLNIGALLKAGGVDPSLNLDRLTFASYQLTNGNGMIGVAEGNFKALQLTKFFIKTAKNPHPPQYQGVDMYTAQGLTFMAPDPTVLVFGSEDAVKTAIDTEQGLNTRIDSNAAITDLIAGTETADVWSVLDPAGSRLMVHSLIGQSPIAGLDPSMLDKYFNGARYTIAFKNDIQFNLELVTTDPLGAAAISTGLRAAIDMRQHQETNTQAKAVLGQIEVDSAGDNVFMQLSSTEDTLVGLMHTDLLQQITR